jgi:hypothetical protein
MSNTADVTGGKPIAVLLQSISGVSAINPLVAFYDIHGGKSEYLKKIISKNIIKIIISVCLRIALEVLFFYFVPDTTRDLS